MLKKICRYFVLGLALSSWSLENLYAQDSSWFPSQCSDHPFMIEAKAACFFPTNQKTQNIYSSVSGLYGLEMSWREWKPLYAWISGSYLSQDGKSIGGNYITHVDLVPIGLGLKWVQKLKLVDLYLGAGPLYSYIHMHDHSPYVIPSVFKWSWGGTGKVGVYMLVKKQFFIDVFSEYSYMKFNFHNGQSKVIRHNVNFSGWSIGASIGFVM